MKVMFELGAKVMSREVPGSYNCAFLQWELTAHSSLGMWDSSAVK